MKIVSGLENGQVAQRGPSGTGVLRVEGTCAGADGHAIRLSVTGENFQHLKPQAGEVSGGRWTAQVDDIPAGGPYRVDAACGSESCSVEDIYVGEVWILAGQSNMEGVGDLYDVEPPSPLVRVMDLADRWGIAEEPLHWPFEAVDSVHWGCDPEQRPVFAREHRSNRVKGAGLGLPFGAALSSALGVPVGLVVCARGGTSMQEWSPSLLDQGGASLYGSMIRRARKVGPVRGILWYQGESDTSPVDSIEFPHRFRDFVLAIRRDLEFPDLPFLYVQLGRFICESSLADLRSWNEVQEAQRTAVSQMEHTAMAAAVDLELDDLIHVGTQGLRRLGRRLANLARSRVYGDEDILTGPQPKFFSVEGINRDRIVIEFSHVNGRLQCAGRLSGFSIRNLDGYHIPIIYKEEIATGRRNAVQLWLTRGIPRGGALYYGWGRDPYCNLVDERDLAAPVFGPVYL